MRKVIVTGSREFSRVPVIWNALAEVDPQLIIHGGARGADSWADEWAHREERDTHVFRPKWKTGYGTNKAAGHFRNQRMLEAYPGVLVLAFITPVSRGTWDCITRARVLGHQVIVRDEQGAIRPLEAGLSQPR